VIREVVWGIEGPGESGRKTTISEDGPYRTRAMLIQIIIFSIRFDRILSVFDRRVTENKASGTFEVTVC